MAKIDEDEKDIEIPNETDENVGDGVIKKKKRKKTKEERIAERKVIFWTFLVIIFITLGFWLMPKISSLIKGEPVVFESNEKEKIKPSIEKPEKKNYVEITL